MTPIFKELPIFTEIDQIIKHESKLKHMNSKAGKLGWQRWKIFKVKSNNNVGVRVSIRINCPETNVAENIKNNKNSLP